MILADKIMKLRKKNGWSQEDLANKINVSRQAVSKWESSQATPNLEKILFLSNLFGVTTDYLLKDDLEENYSKEDTDVKVTLITFLQASEFLEWRKSAAIRIAIATLLCIISPIPLLLLAVATEKSTIPLSESTATGIGLIILLIIVSIAVGIFIICGFKNEPYEFIDKDIFETEYEVVRMVKKNKKSYRKFYVKTNIIATCICVLSPIPLFLVVFTEKIFITVIMLTVTIFFAGIGVGLFILTGVYWKSMQKLLQEGAFSPQKKIKNPIRKKVSLIYWLTTTAVYIGWSFFTNAWDTTWIVWPIAGVLSVGIMTLCNLIIESNNV